MKSNAIVRIALTLAVGSVALNIQQYCTFRERVTQVIDIRERNYSQELAEKLNKSREIMGRKPVTPTNFAEVLSSYFEGMASVMDAGVLNSTNATPDKK
jgi:hypothetical protein